MWCAIPFATGLFLGIIGFFIGKKFSR